MRISVNLQYQTAGIFTCSMDIQEFAERVEDGIETSGTRQNVEIKLYGQCYYRICFIFNTFCWVFIFAGKEVYGVAEKVVENQDIIEIGNNIQKIRKKNGISQSVLAEKIDVAGNSIYRMEGATTVMGVDKLINIADALNTSPMDILPARFQRERKSFTQEKAEQLQIWNDLNEGNRNIVLTMMRMLLTEQQKCFQEV